MNLVNQEAPRAITMWDFSWLERRWPGAGYEDIGQALDELVERGYDAVRIDAYPHLVAKGAESTWTIQPCWNQQVWGSPARNKIQVQPHLNEFLQLCLERGIKVGLSTWFQRTEEADLNQIFSPERHAEIWKLTLDTIAEAGLLESIYYVDLCNEWPFRTWAPFFQPGATQNARWKDEDSISWIKAAVAHLRQFYPDLPYTFSYVGRLKYEPHQIEDIKEANDFLEPHVWMVHAANDSFYRRINHVYDTFDTKGYDNLSKYGQELYETDPSYWQGVLEQHIDHVVAESIELDRMLITTECWGIVNYKDWPLLDWGWVKELCACGVHHAAKQGRWLAMATSNFCGPQFVGMWRDVAWHQEMTSIIKQAPLPQTSPRVNGAKAPSTVGP